MERLKKAFERARQEAEASQPKSIGRKIQSHVPDTGAQFNYTQIPVFQPDAKTLAKNRVIADTADAANEAAVTAYNILRTQVLQRMRPNNWKTVAITSPAPGEGKTLTAINLAISLARPATHTVVLIDLDLRRPRVHQYFDYSPEHGIADHLLRDVLMPDVLFNPQVDNLVVLPGRESVSNSSELLSSPKMTRLVEELKSRYPTCILLFDLPPLLAADDVLAFAPNADAVLIVIEDGKRPREELNRCVELLGSTRVLGTVLNKSQEFNTLYYRSPQSGDPA